MNKKIIALIPARLGSVRVKAKSLRLIKDKPLIYYSIDALKECTIFSDIYVNSDSELIGKVANRYGVKFYKRNPELATSDSNIDNYIKYFKDKGVLVKEDNKLVINKRLFIPKNEKEVELTFKFKLID